jgi:hypothetical protein
MRFEDSRGLFGRNDRWEVTYEITCGICQTTYNAGRHWSETQHDAGVPVKFAVFHDRFVCGNCFESLEAGVIHYREYIEAWFKRMDAAKSREKRQIDLAMKKAHEQVTGIVLSDRRLRF